MEALKKFRQSVGLTTTEMAEKIQVSKSLYEKVELGFREPSRKFIQKVKKTYPQFDTNIFFI
jgi:transcriptional regulator with XRE-family HTH domain